MSLATAALDSFGQLLDDPQDDLAVLASGGGAGDDERIAAGSEDDVDLNQATAPVDRHLSAPVTRPYDQAIRVISRSVKAPGTAGFGTSLYSVVT